MKQQKPKKGFDFSELEISSEVKQLSLQSVITRKTTLSTSNTNIFITKLCISLKCLVNF